MLARVLAIGLCLYVYLSVYLSLPYCYDCFKTAARIELVFLAYKEIMVSPKIRYFPLELCLKLCTQKFSHATSTVAACDKQTTVVGLLLTTLCVDGRSRQLLSTVNR